MTPDPALTTPEQTALNAGGHTIRRYLSVYQPTSQSMYSNVAYNITSWPITEIDFNLSPGSYVPNTVKRGMTVVVTTSGGALRGIYRVTKDCPGTTTFINVGTLAEGDPGLVAMGYRTVGIQNGDTVTIYNRHDIWGTYPDYSGSAWREDGMTYADWVTEYTTGNRYPDCVINLGKHRSVFVDAGQVYATMTFTCEVLVWIAGAVTLGWIFPGSWTITAGSSSTASFTARVPAGFHILEMVVTHDSGKTTRARRLVWVHDTGSNAPIPLVEIVSDERDRTGRQMVLGLNDNALASVPDGAMVNYFEICSWNGSDVPTATTNFTGWITRESKRITKGLRRADVGIVGPADLLKLIPAYSQYLTAVATPATHQEIYSGLCGLQFVIFNLLTKRAANIPQLFDLNFLHDASTPPIIYYDYWKMPSWAIPQASNLLGQIQTLAKNARVNYGHSSTGAMWIMPHPSETIPEVGGVYARTTVVRDRLTTNRYTWPVNFEKRKKPEYRRTQIKAFCYAASTTITAIIGEAPVGAIGQGPNEDIINDYVTQTTVLANAQTELNVLAGQVQAAHNNPLPDVPFQIPDNRDVYEPAQMSFVASDVPAAQDPDGIGWTNAKGVPIRVSKRHNNNGTAKIELHLEMETAGVSGGTITVV